MSIKEKKRVNVSKIAQEIILYAENIFSLIIWEYGLCVTGDYERKSCTKLKMFLWIKSTSKCKKQNRHFYFLVNSQKKFVIKLNDFFLFFVRMSSFFILQSNCRCIEINLVTRFFALNNTTMRCELFHNNKFDFKEINFIESCIYKIDPKSQFLHNHTLTKRLCSTSMNLCTICCNKILSSFSPFFFFHLTAILSHISDFRESRRKHE